MKRTCFIFTVFALLILLGCRKVEVDCDTFLSVVGSSPEIVTQFDSAGYTAPIAYGEDCHGELPVQLSGMVDLSNAGEYNLCYSIVNYDGITTSRNHTVIVDGARYLCNKYSIAMYINGTYTATYNDSLVVDPDTHNSFTFSRFANFVNAYVHGSTYGQTISIPSQEVYCGNPCTAYIFEAEGHYSDNSNCFIINFTITTDITENGYLIFTRN